MCVAAVCIYLWLLYRGCRNRKRQSVIEIQEKDLRKVEFRKQPDDVRIFIPMEEDINKNCTHYHQLIGWYICMWGPLPGRPSGRYRGVYPAFIKQLRKEEKEAAKKKRRRLRAEMKHRRVQRKDDMERGYSNCGPRAMWRGVTRWSTRMTSRAAASSIGRKLLCYWD
ncbi:hypothetical protein LSAT2_020113 [Lamellibrachia satsuma]|nr:hypothetical protein LSAT2_020113 [Lamellibrachia satsuma]